jgi:hypothetical protein
MASLEKELENGLLGLMSPISGVNLYNSERKENRIIPYLSIKVSIDSELLGVFTGVFKCTGNFQYVQKADGVSRADFDSKFQEIVNQLYQDPPVTQTLTGNTNVTVYDLKINQNQPSINSMKRHWENSIDMEIIATFSK